MSLDPSSLRLEPHPEGGWYRETWRHESSVEMPRGRRSLVTYGTFLLQPGEGSTVARRLRRIGRV